MAQRLTTIEIAKEYLHFSAAHFTIFSATERERLHGHNFYVAVTVTAEVGENGLCFDYNLLKSRLRQICVQYDEYLLLPAQSPHISVESRGDDYRVTFAGEELLFPQSDTLLLDVRNISVEELSHLLLEQVVGDKSLIADMRAQEISLKVSSGPGQWGVSHWAANSG